MSPGRIYDTKVVRNYEPITRHILNKILFGEEKDEEEEEEEKEDIHKDQGQLKSNQEHSSSSSSPLPLSSNSSQTPEKEKEKKERREEKRKKKEKRGKRTLAASLALSISSRVDKGVRATTSCVAGLITSKYLSVFDSTNSPLIKRGCAFPDVIDVVCKYCLFLVSLLAGM